MRLYLETFLGPSKNEEEVPSIFRIADTSLHQPAGRLDVLW